MTSQPRIKPLTTFRARHLRGGMTDAENRLWRQLRSRQINGHRFRRQHPVGEYIADFACIEKMLLVELDGGQHQQQLAYDAQRTQELNKLGWQVLRFWNNDVMENMEGVLAVIAKRLDTPPSWPSPCAGEGTG